MSATAEAAPPSGSGRLETEVTFICINSSILGIVTTLVLPASGTVWPCAARAAIMAKTAVVAEVMVGDDDFILFGWIDCTKGSGRRS